MLFAMNAFGEFKQVGYRSPFIWNVTTTTEKNYSRDRWKNSISYKYHAAVIWTFYEKKDEVDKTNDWNAKKKTPQKNIERAR